MANAAQLAVLGINAAKPFIDNSDYFARKGRENIDKIKRKSVIRYYADGSKEEARPRGGFVAAGDPRSKSTGDYSDYSSEDDYYARRSGRGRNNRRKDARDAYESEGSVPPRSRGVVARRDGAQAAAPYNGAGAGAGAGATSYAGTTKSENDRDSADSSDSSVIDSDEDHRLQKKKRRNELLTGGIATVATLNAAALVYNSMKTREQRHRDLAAGNISAEQAKADRYKHHMQDAAMIGIAALSIKGAYGKWQGTLDKHREHKSHRTERRERHQKRLRKGLSNRNRSSSREAAARMGRPAPGYEQQAQSYAQAPQRPAYNRAYSRSLEDVRQGNYVSNPGYRSYGRDRGYGYDRSGRANDDPGEVDDMAQYDVGHA